MTEPFTANDLRNFLGKKWRAAGCKVPRRKGMGKITEDIARLSITRNRKLEDPHLELWVAIYDEFVSWLMSLLSIVHWNTCKKPYQPTEFEKAVVLLLMRIVSDSLAIRHLMVLGFDAAAQTQVRSTTEHMEVLAAILDDPSMAIDFCKGRDEAKANRFWKIYLSKQKIRPRIKAVWMKFFDGDHGAAKWFANWGSNDYQKLSAIAHPSFLGCVHAVLPAKATYSDEVGLGIWGEQSLTSIGTIQTYLSFLFPLIIAIGDFPFGKTSKLFGRARKYSATNERHKHVKHGRSVLASLILSLNKEENQSYIYPEVAPLA